MSLSHAPVGTEGRGTVSLSVLPLSCSVLEPCLAAHPSVSLSATIWAQEGSTLWEVTVEQGQRWVREHWKEEQFRTGWGEGEDPLPPACGSETDLLDLKPQDVGGDSPWPRGYDLRGIGVLHEVLWVGEGFKEQVVLATRANCLQRKGRDRVIALQ